MKAETIEEFEQRVRRFEETGTGRDISQPWPVTLQYIDRADTPEMRQLAAQSRAGLLPCTPCRIEDAVLVHTAYRKEK
ncbi:hypothetical protein I2I11_04005 [Pontibacter sp. 172403-2]|uniref:hypothetical protein n=1 Tax=Pontibacter rufus TaxID=2791028 RepID=UPI0018AFD6D0|nr:hypothetical protein [Pontibacter sp. 172403-2]MBF9252448.1 hypothetical protein [Pontibacter sp. 172403-2]